MRFVVNCRALAEVLKKRLIEHWRFEITAQSRLTRQPPTTQMKGQEEIIDNDEDSVLVLGSLQH